jgi:hypothetical protein
MRLQPARLALLLGLCAASVALAQPHIGTHGVCDLNANDPVFPHGMNIVNGGRNGSVLIYCNHGYRTGGVQGGGPGLPLLDQFGASVRFYAVCHAATNGLIQDQANRSGLPCLGPNGVMSATTGQVYRPRLCIFDSGRPNAGPYWDHVELPPNQAYSRCMPGGTPQPCPNALGCFEPGTFRDPQRPSYGPNWPAPWNRPPGTPCDGTCRTNMDGPIVPPPPSARPPPGSRFPSFGPSLGGAMNGLGPLGVGAETAGRSLGDLGRGINELGDGNWEGCARAGIGGGGLIAGTGLAMGGAGMAAGGSAGAGLTAAGLSCFPVAAGVATAGVCAYAGSEVSTATGLDTALGTGMCGAYDTVAALWRWEFDYSLTSACWNSSGTRPKPVSTACDGGSRQRVDPPFRGGRPSSGDGSGGCGAAPTGEASLALVLLCGVLMSLRRRARR